MSRSAAVDSYEPKMRQTRFQDLIYLRRFVKPVKEAFHFAVKPFGPRCFEMDALLTEGPETTCIGPLL
jgi:hypothetical protein